MAVSASVKARRNGSTSISGHLEAAASEIGRLLTRQGVATEVRRDSTRDVPLADLLLNRITDECAGLIVMGRVRPPADPPGAAWWGRAPEHAKHDRPRLHFPLNRRARPTRAEVILSVLQGELSSVGIIRVLTDWRRQVSNASRRSHGTAGAVASHPATGRSPNSDGRRYWLTSAVAEACIVGSRSWIRVDEGARGMSTKNQIGTKNAMRRRGLRCSITTVCAALFVVGAWLPAHGQSASSPVMLAAATEEVEAALGLRRSERRRIQEGLASLGFDPGPADGVFGPRTRKAIAAWQASLGGASTGYLHAGAAETLLEAGEAARPPKPKGIVVQGAMETLAQALDVARA